MAAPGNPVTRANETMLRAVVAFVGRSGGRAEAQRPVTTGRRSEAADGAFRGMSPGGAIR